MKNWSESATKATAAFRKADEAALMKDRDKALMHFAECRAWLEITMLRLATEEVE